MEVSHASPRGVQKDTFTGTLLWTVVSAAQPIEGSGSRTYLQHTLIARGQDSYSVALAIGELDPDFENKQVLIAYEQNGAPLAALKLVVPGDSKAGRSVRDLIAIELR